jgi:hypothetical protein
LKYLLFSLLFVVFFSCKKEKQDSIQKQDSKPLLSVVKEYGVTEKVNALFLKDVEDWQELKAVDDFLLRFKKASPNEVLSNALELESLVSSLKDSVTPALFDIPSFSARINILHNETLRLADMTFIAAIKAPEVTTQTEKIISAFSGVNSKVNIILSKKRFEDAIGTDIIFIGLDSTKIDTISKKSIKKNFKGNLLNKKRSKAGFFEKPKRLQLPTSKEKQDHIEKQAFVLDSIKSDTISKKQIKKNFEGNLLNKKRSKAGFSKKPKRLQLPLSKNKQL